MKLQTKSFGEIEINDNEIVHFESGMPGFEDKTRFTLISDSDNRSFCWLQSLDDTNLAFALLDVGSVMPEYNPKIDSTQLSDIGNIDNNLLIYNVVVIPEKADEMSVNLVAPIVINKDSKKGKQVIVNNEDYGVKHYIFKN